MVQLYKTSPPHFRCQLQAQVITCDSDHPAKYWRSPQLLPWVRLFYWSISQNSGNCSLGHLFIIKGYNSGAVRWKRCMGKSALSRYVAPPYVHQSRSPQNPVLLRVMEASLHRHDWLNDWLLAVDKTSSPYPFPTGHGGGTESASHDWPLGHGSSP